MIRLTREQVREIDRRSIEEYHIPGIVLMENAARAVVDVAMEMLRDVERTAAMIFCGGGNNGGDGFAVARHLHNRGIEVSVVPTADYQSYRGDALANLQIVQAMKLDQTCPEDADIPLAGGVVGLIIDALIGTGLQSPPRDVRWIDLINEFPVPVLAIDVPSGMNCDTGEPMGACVRAERTVTFVAEKAGFANLASKQYTGEITVGDIGCPRDLVEEVAKMKPT